MESRLTAGGVSRCVCYGDAGRSAPRDDGRRQVLVHRAPWAGRNITWDAASRHVYPAILVVGVVGLHDEAESVVPVDPISEHAVATCLDTRQDVERHGQNVAGPQFQRCPGGFTGYGGRNE